MAILVVTNHTKISDFVNEAVDELCPEEDVMQISVNRVRCFQGKASAIIIDKESIQRWLLELCLLLSGRYPRKVILLASSDISADLKMRYIQAGVSNILFDPSVGDIKVALLNCFPKQILLVDNDFHVRTIMKEVLEEEGYMVHESPGGVEALQYLEHNTPDLIISDVLNPHMSGFDFINQVRLIREQRGRSYAEAGKQMNPMFVMIHSGGGYTREECITAGADDSLPKPSSRAGILIAVRHLLGQAEPVLAA